MEELFLKMAVVTLPDFTPRTKNYVSLYASLVPIVVGTALIWHNSLIVTVNDNAARAANYYLLAFYYIWVCSVTTHLSVNARFCFLCLTSLRIIVFFLTCTLNNLVVLVDYFEVEKQRIACYVRRILPSSGWSSL